MENKTMTSRDFYSAVVKANISDEMTAYALDYIKKLDERNQTRKERGTTAQRLNVIIKRAIVDALDYDTTYTASEVASMGIEGITSTQKASALLRSMVEDGAMTTVDVKIKGKGKVKGYTLVKPEEEEEEDEISDECEEMETE